MDKFNNSNFSLLRLTVMYLHKKLLWCSLVECFIQQNTDPSVYHAFAFYLEFFSGQLPLFNWRLSDTHSSHTSKVFSYLVARYSLSFLKLLFFTPEEKDKPISRKTNAWNALVARGLG